MFSLDVFGRILKLNTGVSQSANIEMFRLLSSIHPFEIRRYKSGREHNGWVIPHDWVVKKALIRKDGEILFDGSKHPLAIAGYSCSFKGVLSKDELDQHVFFREERPDAYAFHCMNNYRAWARFWGFCVPYNVYRNWTDGTYEVDLETQYCDGEMLVGEVNHRGRSDETIVFNAHTCHPCQFNDDLAGVATILELFKWLANQNTRYSYRGILAPEHLGTIFYLADLPEAERAKLKMGAFVEMVGIDAPFALQRSFTGASIIDRIAEYTLRQMDPHVRVGGFRTIVGNDETVWEGPGIEIPFASISRCWHSPQHYPQYHTSEDDLSVNSERRLEGALEALKMIVHIIEEDRTIHRNFVGLVALSNPKYDLYIERPDPTVHKDLSEMQLRMGELQDSLPRYFDGKHTVFEIAEKFNLPFDCLLDYLKKFAAKGLIKFSEVAALDGYSSL